MKRICFITDSIFSIGGVQRVTAVIAKELTMNYDVTIVTFDDQNHKDTKLYCLVDSRINYCFFSYPIVNTLKKRICRLYSGIYLRLQPQAKWCSDLYARSSFCSEYRPSIIKELHSGNYDVVIGVHAPLTARLASVRKHFAHTKLIGWVHNSFEAIFGEESHYYIGSNRKRHYVYQFRKLDDVVLLSHQDAKSYYEYDPLFKPTVIYNPLTLKPGLPSEGNTKRFLAIGRFSHQHKGFDLLIEAFHIFSEKNKEWKLDIVGEGVEEELYKSLIEKYHLEDRVFIHPFTNNVQEYYSNAQVYVLSSRWEGFGLVLELWLMDCR